MLARARGLTIRSRRMASPPLNSRVRAQTKHMGIPNIGPLLQSLAIGSHVLVSATCAGWRNDFYGVICGGPERVETMQGQDYFYWIQFDSPQHDLSEDGPYYKAQILGRCLAPAP